MKTLITGLIGGLFGSFITHMLASWRDENKEFRDAAKRLRSAFTTELADLDPSRIDSQRHSFDSFLRDALPKHREAIAEFGFYLSDKAREELNKEFHVYIKGIYEGDYDAGLKMISKVGSHDLFQERVRAILKYAEYKPWYKRFFL
jgi:hypothetical protein